MRYRLVILAAAMAAAISGCAVQRAHDTVYENEARATRVYDQVHQARSERPRTVNVRNTPWVSLEPIPTAHLKDTPKELLCNITFAPVQGVTIFEFGQSITSLCGIPVRISRDAVEVMSGGGVSNFGGSPAVGIGSSLPPPNLAGVEEIDVGFSQSIQGSFAGAGDGLITNIKWQDKPLSGLLDAVTSRLGLSWRYEKGVIRIFYLDTRVFQITAIPSQTSVSSVVTTESSLSSGGGAGSSSTDSGLVDMGGGSNQSTEVAIRTNIMEDIKNTLENMLTPMGKLSLSFSTGSVSVTDTPEVLDQIQVYLDRENASLRRMVRINVDMLVVTLDESDRFGIDWNLVYNQVSGKYGASLSSNVAQGADSIMTGFGVLDTANSNFSGTKLFFDALSTQGSVSVVTTPTINTLNLQPAPIQIAEQQYYVQSSSSTTVPDVGVESSLELGSITTGFNASVLPFIVDGDNLILQFSASISPRAKLREITSGNALVEAPETSSRTFSQQVALRSGQTMVLSGYEQVSDTGNLSGMGDPSFMLAGGSTSRRATREVLVILITPVIAGM